MTRRDVASDAGAALLMALVFISGIGLVVGGLLNYTGTSLRTGSTLANRSQTDYDVDGALQAAVNTVRQSSYDNGTGESCLSSGALDVPGVTGTVRVMCLPGAGTGAAAGLVPVNSSNKPGSAILTVGTNASEPGIGLSSNGTLLVKGRVVSNSTITGGGANSVLSSPYAQVKAKGACTATITSTPAAACNYTPTTDAADFADPGYAPPSTATADLTYRAVPSCGSNPVVFQPGYYDDASGLSALTSGSCSRTFWFQPGQYYFDFHNADGGGGLPSGSDVWTIADRNVRVVAGTPQGWTTSPFTAPSIPGACVSPLTTTSNSGVQWAFGGDSRLVVSAGQVEVCGTYSSTKPALAVYGIPTGTDSPVSAVTKTNGGGITPSGTVAFANMGYAKDQDGTQAATATITGGNSTDTTGSMLLGDFSTTAIPAGALLQSAQIEVWHKENPITGTLKSIQVSGSIDTGGSPTTIAATNLTPSTSWRLDAVPVPLTALQTKLHAGTPVLSSIRLDATAGKKSSGVTNSVAVSVDSVQLRLVYKPPAVRGESTALASGANCIGTAPYIPGSGGCALITTSGAQSRLYLEGTTYAPRAALDVSLTNVSAQVFRAGLIARSLRITVTASSSYSGPVIEIPDDSPGYAAAPLAVYFLAYVCPSGVTCSSSAPGTGWRLAGQAKATFTDTSSSPTPGSRQVTVNTWQITR